MNSETNYETVAFNLFWSAKLRIKLS